MNRHEHSHTTGSTARIEALSDGVFAIVMTLLVFDIKVPTVPVEQLPTALVDLWPKFLGYAISFAILGIYWTGHRAQFNYIHRADHTMHWINILFLACVAFVPFATSLLDSYPGSRLTLTIYGANLILIGMVLYWHWVYATTNYRLVDVTISPVVVRFATQRCLLAPICYALAIGLGFVHPILSIMVYVIVPILYIVPHLQSYWLRLASR